ncbi:MAG: PEP-CTERM sorting domain-containing protein [Phycisphaerae bacterium]|nr:PEP-CTERM sorting domain-containing protein [Phycisphaerae bacterium]
MYRIILVSCLTLVLATVADAQFSNPTPIGWVGATYGPATPYPSEILVFGMTDDVVVDVTVTLFDLSHTFPADLDILLVAPTGDSVLLMSDMGGGDDIVDVDLTFADGYPEVPSPIVSGTYCPTDVDSYPSDDFPGSAPIGPWGSEMEVFNVLPGSALNGIWSLYVFDDMGIDTGSIAGGWSIAIPEPSALALLALGGLAMVRRR